MVTPTVAAPAALAYSTENCQVARAMAVLGEKGAVIVLREIFNGVRRFEHIHQRSGLPRQVLTNRLALLVAEGVLHRVPYREPGARERFEYRLTEKGFDLYPVLCALADWGARHYAGPEGPPVQLVHRECGAAAHAVLRCEAGHPIEDLHQIAPAPGPGAVVMPA